MLIFSKIYQRINWKNYPNKETAIDEQNLNKMDKAIDEIDNRVVQLSGYSDMAEEFAKQSKSYAIGTNGEVRPDDSTDNSKYYYEIASNKAQEAKEYSDNANLSKISANNSAVSSSDNASSAAQSATNAATKANEANSSAEVAISKANEANSSAEMAASKANEASDSASSAKASEYASFNSSQYAHEIVEDIEEKLETGYFIGPQGERGDSGVIVPTNGVFCFVGDQEGNLWCYYADNSNPPSFETDESGNIYMIMED